MGTKQMEDYFHVACLKRCHEQRQRSFDLSLLYSLLAVSLISFFAADKKHRYYISAFHVPLFEGVQRLREFKVTKSRDSRMRILVVAGKNTRIEVEENDPLDTQSQQENQMFSSVIDSVTTNRRQALCSMAVSSIAFFPYMAVASPPTARQFTDEDPLQRCALGGQWNQLDPSMLDSNNSFRLFQVPAVFSTYLTRFLIHYDRGVSAWWEQQEFTYSMLSPSDRAEKLFGLFGMLSKSVERAIQNYVDEPNESYTKLWDLLITTYGEEPDARRHIAILFSFLPMNQQPTTRLLEYYESLDSKSSFIIRVNDETNYQIRTSLSNNFNQLLPSNFQIISNIASQRPLSTDVCFTVVPKIAWYKVGVGDKLDQSSLATLFGPLGSQPLIREYPHYSVDVYGLFGLAGASGCALTHSLVIPLDVVKTRAQTDPAITLQSNSNYTSTVISPARNGIWDAGTRIIEKEGFSGLLLGAQATVAGYFWYGLSVYPSYTFLKRFLTRDILPTDYATTHSNEIALVAGAIAAVLASIGLTPLEAARIRVVAEPQIYRSLGLLGTLKVIADEDPALGWKNLFAGLPPLLTRQVVFGSVKFLAYERCCDLIFHTFPFLRETILTELAVSLVAGGVSGAVSSVVSQPADSVLTYIAAKSKLSEESTGILDGVRKMVTEEGMGSLFRGLGSRCVWAGSIIAGQFLLYDIARAVFRVTTADLSQIYEFTFIGGSV